MDCEDGQEKSFAGIMETRLFVTRTDLEKNIIEVYQSLFSERSMRYSQAVLKAAVIIQEMIPSEKSGVAFSRSPAIHSALTCIEAVYGVGEGLVGGRVTPDTFYLDRFHNPVRSEIREKDNYLSHDGTGSGLKLFALPDNKKRSPVLELEELKAINGKLLELEELHGYPLDMEWAYCRNRLYVLQARPITSPFPPLAFYVDTNLSESYPGKTSWLTSSFVRQVYEQTFAGASRYLLGRTVLPLSLEKHLKTLVHSFKGHLYYNLNSYYAVLLSLPGGKVNLENWHRMIGGKLDRQIDPKRYFIPSLGQTLKILSRLLTLAVFHGKIFSRFYEEAEKQLHAWNLRKKSCKTWREAAGLLFQVMDEVKGFELTIINDLLIMLSIKAMLLFPKSAGITEQSLPGLIAMNGAAHSINALGELIELTHHLENKPRVMTCFKTILEHESSENPQVFYGRFFEQLDNEGLRQSSQKIQGYLEKYGERSFEELKLESLTFSEDPESFYRFLSWNLEHAKSLHAANPSRRIPEKAGKSLKGLGAFLFKRVIKFCQQVILTRENTRLVRGRFYGFFRNAFLHLGRLLKAQAPEWFADIRLADFFYLTLEDLRNITPESLQSLAGLIKRRKEADTPVKAYPEFYCHPVGEEDALEPYFLAADNRVQEHGQRDGKQILTGQGAAGGIVEGTAFVLFNPQQAMGEEELSGKILVTKNTDPAWIFLMSRSCGLISEKGSLLSHTAIIGRELGIPTIVGVKNACTRIENRTRLRMDATRGTIELLRKLK
jgi:pyruvate,water dikinase